MACLNVAHARCTSQESSPTTPTSPIPPILPPSILQSLVILPTRFHREISYAVYCSLGPPNLSISPSNNESIKTGPRAPLSWPGSPPHACSAWRLRVRARRAGGLRPATVAMAGCGWRPLAIAGYRWLSGWAPLIAPLAIRWLLAGDPLAIPLAIRWLRWLGGVRPSAKEFMLKGRDGLP
jgi:hypothetical protein